MAAIAVSHADVFRLLHIVYGVMKLRLARSHINSVQRRRNYFESGGLIRASDASSRLGVLRTFSHV